MAGMGMSLLGGAAGAAGGLETLVARRLQEQQQAEIERRAQVDEAQRSRALDETMRSRQANEAEMQRYHQELAADRETQRNLQKVNLAMLKPAGSYMTADEVQQERDLGMPAGFYDAQEGGSSETQGVGPNGEVMINTKVQAPGFRFKGKEADLIKRAGIEDADKNKDLDRMMRLTIAQLMASTGRNTEQEIPVQNPDGSTTYMRRSQAEGHQAPWGQATKDRVTAYRTTLDLVDEIQRLGDATNWQGLGGMGTGTVKRLLKRGIGVGSDQAETLRNMLDRLRAQASFQEGGKQFTGTEAELMDNFLSSVNSNSQTAKLRLAEFKRMAENSLGQLGGNRSTFGSGFSPMPSHAGAPGGAPPRPGNGQGRKTAEELIRQYGGVGP